jgi:predicted dehydrogenase
MDKTSKTSKSTQLGRREFLAGAAAAATFTILRPSLVRGTEANSKIALGLIGCGGRGGMIAGLFAKHGGYQLASCGDYFADRAKGVGNKHKLDDAHCHSGLSNYKKVLADNVDAVAIISPPYFHPGQAAAAVEAGKHVYVAKPIAVDVPGCASIEESGKKAAAKKLVFLVDFQTRANAFYQEAVKRVQNGDIGRLVNGTAGYFCGLIFGTELPADAEGRLRHWGMDKVLSGDIITEQNIHSIDVCSWIADAQPLTAVGTGGRKLRTGDNVIFDHFNLVFEYPDGLAVSFASRQFGAGPGGIDNVMYGTKGAIETHYGGDVKIHGKAPYPGGNTGKIYVDGPTANIATFCESIKAGKAENPTLAPSVRSNLTTILGRMAAYTGRKITWDEMIKANEKLDPHLDGAKD